MRAIEALVRILAVSAGIIGLAAAAWIFATWLAFAEETITIEEDVPNVPQARGEAHLCDTAGASAAVKAGGVSISVPTYPCEVYRTYQTLDRYEHRKGPLAAMARFFLKVRLGSRGIFSAVFGLFGLG